MATQPESLPAVNSADPGYPPARQGWTAVMVLLVLYLVSSLDRHIISLFGDHIKADFRLTDMELGLIFGPAFALSYAIGALPFGWAMDRFSRRTVLWLGVTIWSLGTIACGLSRGFGQLFTARLFVGSGEAVLVPGNQSILADMFPPERLAFPISVYTLGSRIGQGSSLMIGGLFTAILAPGALFMLPIVGELAGWQIILIMVGLPGLIVALCIFLIREPKRLASVNARAASSSYRAYFAHMRRNWRFYTGHHLGSVSASAVATALGSWTPIYFQREFGWSVAQVGFWLGTILVAGTLVGTPLHGFLSDRFFRAGIRDAHLRYLFYALLLSAVPLTAGYLVADPWLALVLICVGQALMIAMTVLVPTSLQLMTPGEMRGKAASVILVVSAIGGIAAGPAIVAAISENFYGSPHFIGEALAIVVVCGLALAATALFVALKPLRRAYSAF